MCEREGHWFVGTHDNESESKRVTSYVRRVYRRARRDEGRALQASLGTAGEPEMGRHRRASICDKISETPDRPISRRGRARRRPTRRRSTCSATPFAGDFKMPFDITLIGFSMVNSRVVLATKLKDKKKINFFHGAALRKSW